MSNPNVIGSSFTGMNIAAAIRNNTEDDINELKETRKKLVEKIYNVNSQIALLESLYDVATFKPAE